MANNWFWDLGFDLNAVTTNNQTLLPNGFVMMGATINGTTCNVPATPVNISIGDTIGFNLFNITNPVPAGTIAVTAGSITFQNAVTAGLQQNQKQQTITSPFSNPDGSYMTSIAFPLNAAPTGTGSSVIFSGMQAPLAEVQNQFQFPAYPGPSNLKVANNGRFLISFSVTIQGPSGPPRTFQDDPEMIIGSAG